MCDAPEVSSPALPSPTVWEASDAKQEVVDQPGDWASLESAGQWLTLGRQVQQLKGLQAGFCAMELLGSGFLQTADLSRRAFCFLCSPHLNDDVSEQVEPRQKVGDDGPKRALNVPPAQLANFTLLASIGGAGQGRAGQGRAG